MNKIIIQPDGSRTICGEESHKLANSPNWAETEAQIEHGRFYVFSGIVLKAAQSTIRVAHSYMAPNRVLVYRHALQPPINNAYVAPGCEQFESRPVVQKRKACDGIGVVPEGVQGEHYFAACEACKGLGHKLYRMTVERDRIRDENADLRRFEVGFRNIVTALGYARKPFEIADIVELVERIVIHYGVLRAELVETNAKAMFDLFQAAANPKDMDYCCTITNAKLRGKCTACDGKGLIGNPATQTQEATGESCPYCEGNGFVEIPELP